MTLHLTDLFKGLRPIVNRSPQSHRRKGIQNHPSPLLVFKYISIFSKSNHFWSKHPPKNHLCPLKNSKNTSFQAAKTLHQGSKPPFCTSVNHTNHTNHPTHRFAAACCRVFTTSKGLLAVAAAQPATKPESRSSERRRGF